MRQSVNDVEQQLVEAIARLGQTSMCLETLAPGALPGEQMRQLLQSVYGSIYSAQRGSGAPLWSALTPLPAAVDQQSTWESGGSLSFADYGGAYEHLLGYKAIVSDTGRIELRPGARAQRRNTGTFYTPQSLVQWVLDAALEPVVRRRLQEAGASTSSRERAILELRVCDPAAGCGRFLIAAAERLAAHLAGVRSGGSAASPSAIQRATEDVVGSCIYGIDIDPIAVALCRGSLALMGERADATVLRERIVHGDALLQERPWNDAQETRFDVVVGNPPFLNQLQSATTACNERARALRSRFGSAIRSYTDLSGAFFMLGEQQLTPGGRIALVQPMSVLASRDAAGVRKALLERSALVALWTSGTDLFPGASVRTCVPVLERDGPRRNVVHRAATHEFGGACAVEVDSDDLARAETWAHLTSDLRGVPQIAISSAATMDSHATATADFRDQYYGLKGFLVEDADVRAGDAAAFPPLITTGLIDLAECQWGVASAKVFSRTWSAPRVDRHRMERDGELGTWMRARLVPKILLATQTRIIEVVVDRDGVLLPCTPIITVVPHDPRRIWHVAAALASPPCTVRALDLYGGTGRSAEAIKLSARQVLAMPAPNDAAAWDDAAHALRAAQNAGTVWERMHNLRAWCEASCRAYSMGEREAEALRDWWWERYTRAMQSKAKTVKQYLAELPKERRDALEAVRAVIVKNLDSGFEEGMQYGMICYRVPHSVYPPGYHCDPKQPLPFAGLASQKNYMSLYMMSSCGEGDEGWLRDQWEKAGKKLDMGKSCIRFKKLDDLPLDVVGKAIRRVTVKQFIAFYEQAILTQNKRASAKAAAKRAPAEPRAAPKSTKRAASKSKRAVARR